MTRRRRRSLRARITSGALLVVVAALCGAGVLLVQVLQRRMTGQIDTTLVANADFLTRAIRSGESLPQQGPTDLYVQFVAGDGRVLGASSSARGLPALATARDAANSRIRSVHSAIAGDLRVLARPSPSGASVTLVVARSSSSVGAVRSSIVRVLAVMLVVGGVLLGALVWVVVGRALRPVDEMRRTVDAIGEEDLGRRVPEPGTGDELDRLAETLNDLLARLDAAFARERRFVADASHELRTPIAGVRALLETEPSDVRSVIDVRAEALARVGQLQDLVEELLVLARSDAAAGLAPAGTVDLDDLVLAQADQLARTTALRVDVSEVSGGQVAGHDTELARVVENLSTNAARHAATTVAYSVRQDGDVVELTVTDDGPGIDPRDRVAVFERFLTLDDARASSHGRSGLGLSIVRSIVCARGGTIHAEDAPGRGARFVVRLPSAGSDAAAALSGAGAEDTFRNAPAG